ncbi:hypothetical protein [Clostridium sp.]|uniref:hypothetical protein n=1 Tax=Clostridium sp. TaxID=1506 RepID=UPI001A48D133|nr:hypothetical protein [Clostridium sp.]MBK5242300.1 hypothetical protein [Clostridium sp.]
MSLVKNNFISVVRKQYGFKLQGFSKFFFIIIVTQIIGMLFTMSNAGGMTSTSNETYSFKIEQNSTIYVFIFTIAIVTGATILLNLKEYKDMDFTFVTNRISSNISNIGFLITLSLFGAVTSALSGVLTRTIKYFLIGSSKIIEVGFYLTPGEIMCSIGANFLYFILFSSLVYFCTVLTQKSNIFFVIILIVVVLFTQTPLFGNIIEFYGKENNFLIFMIKALIMVTIFFTASILVSNNQEVRGLKINI